MKDNADTIEYRQARHGALRAWLARGNVRPTRQRLALANALVGDGHHRHVTAEDLFRAVRSEGEAVSLATVYNTLRLFSAAGLLREIPVDGTRCYWDTRLDNHPHFFWEETGVLSDAPGGALKVADLPDAPEGSAIASVDVVIRLRRT